LFFDSQCTFGLSSSTVYHEIVIIRFFDIQRLQVTLEIPPKCRRLAEIVNAAGYNTCAVAYLSRGFHASRSVDRVAEKTVSRHRHPDHSSDHRTRMNPCIATSLFPTLHPIRQDRPKAHPRLRKMRRRKHRRGGKNKEVRGS